MELLQLLEECGGIRRGLTHFRNGLYSNGWIEKGSVFSHPARLDVVAQEQAKTIAQAFPGATLVVGAPACGAVLASFVAQHLGKAVAYLSLHPEPVWHRMNIPAIPEKVVYVDDLICTGTDARAALAFLRGQGHEVLGVSAWLSRAEMQGEKLMTLAQAPFRNFAREDLPAAAKILFEDVRE